ncbi:Na+/H+ antiporter NhaA [Vibrio quintilis]|uniref:Na(+)/H(+) antiporter NhaA n=1 Tax=Vibrio quintilis TaxID=1117707 RepID=A0A1M7YUV6_9VIBR|nr:Na+/H+ antiporter NhaA [Vibrio quintilis]SHO56402.1 Na(+)/H(+) antiporter NhaA [Vibrio quintilis]
MKNLIPKNLNIDAVSGVLLVVAAIIAMIIANSSFRAPYENVLHTYVLGMSLRHWINDGLMAVFFLSIGLEVKRELLEGALKERETAIFPAIAAIGGMAVPALIYILFNRHDAAAIDGWAIPAATDIAFAIGILSLLGNRVPVSLKVFLLALAIIDDLGVIIIIALFYNSELSTLALTVGMTMVAILLLMNYLGVTKLVPYLLVGAILWTAVLKSGVHATLAGVVLGLSIPLKGKPQQKSPLKALEHDLHIFVALAILPIFAFANAGLSLDSFSMGDLLHHVPSGAALGLFLGKPIGVFCFSWLAVKFNIAKLPSDIDMKEIFGVAMLCGLGFTMSIFISSLAFGDANAQYDTYARIGVLIGSSLSAIVGYIILAKTLPKAPNP